MEAPQWGEGGGEGWVWPAPSPTPPAPEITGTRYFERVTRKSDERFLFDVSIKKKKKKQKQLILLLRPPSVTFPLKDMVGITPRRPPGQSVTEAATICWVRVQGSAGCAPPGAS